MRPSGVDRIWVGGEGYLGGYIVWMFVKAADIVASVRPAETAVLYQSKCAYCCSVSDSRSSLR